MEKRWRNIEFEYDLDLVEELSKEMNIDHVLAQLLVQRGVKSREEANAFFNPKLTGQHNPLLLKDMDLAVARIQKAMQRNEKILVYGDYDVDGTTAVAIVYSFLSLHIDKQYLDFYIPDRYNDGYGISYKGIDYAHENGISLVIALDCGIKAVEKVQYAKTLGIDFIICDHHMPGDEIPAAAACIDPKRNDCTYPDKNLSGCGVGFKLMQALCRLTGFDEKVLNQYLDLLAVSIASDIVPIIGENRILAYHGLKQLNENPSMGLKSIIDVVGLSNTKITISDIVFKIGPRINAAGRMQSGNDAVRLLISASAFDAQQMSEDMEKSNDKRKDLDKTITKEAMDMIENDPQMRTNQSTVLFNPSWHKGVIGIVASRLSETYYRPTIILTEAGGFATGSARSVDGFDIYKAIDACSDLLENFGGHMYAAGLTMKMENVEKFKARFEKYVAENIEPEQLVPQIDIDAELQLSAIDERFFKDLAKFEPFGPGNTKPVFVTNNVSALIATQIGREKQHLKLEIIGIGHRKTQKAIAFGLGNMHHLIKGNAPFNVCYTIEENEFPKGKKTLQLMIKDIHVNKTEQQ